MKHLYSRCSFALAWVLVGCAQVQPQADYERVNYLISEATGHIASYEPDGDALAAERRVHAMLQDGITIDEAVQVALLNNPSLQAGFFRIGISRADFVQSGLFSNPSLAMSFAFPEGGGRSNIQGTLAQNIVDLWQIPIRKRIAQARLEQEILSLSQQAARLVVDTRVAYFNAVGVTRKLEIAEANLQLATGLRDTTVARQKAGAIGELDVNLARGTMLNNDLDLQTARLDAANAKRRLAVLLGLTHRAEQLSLLDPLPAVSKYTLDEDGIVALARSSRLDLRALQSAVAAGRQRVAEEYAKIFPDVAIGVYLERTEQRALPGRDIAADTARASIASGQLTAPDIQSRGQRDQERGQEIDVIFGPALNMTLPIFDQNQAQIAKADYAYRAALKDLDALDRQIVQEARRALDQAVTAARLSHFYEGQILPQAQKTLDLASSSYKACKTSILFVLDAQRSLLSTRRLAVTVQQSAATALAELELVVGRPLPVIVQKNQPSSQSESRSTVDTAAQPARLEKTP